MIFILEFLKFGIILCFINELDGILDGRIKKFIDIFYNHPYYE